MEILQQMLQRAQSNPQRIVLPEGDEPRTLEAANIILRDKIANLILIGDPAVINQMAEEKGYEHVLKGENLTILDPLTDPKMSEYANLLFELRKAKGMTLEQATEKVKDPLYLGCLMIKNGDADGELAG
ncbi:MAG: phosphate acetyltransferase, partial [Paludibacteraceae bacterium]|nr:phosphate acetyltransferase [Paludibacteraceae bacterium]